MWGGAGLGVGIVTHGFNNNTFKSLRVTELAHRVKAFATKLHGPGSSPGTHRVERMNQLPQVVLRPPHVCSVNRCLTLHAHTQMHACTHIINKSNKILIK